MSLKADLKKRIIEGVIQKAKTGDEFIVLVLDEHTTRIVSSCARVYDVMDSGVLVLESLAKKRERLDMPAAYFIEPSEQSVKLLLEDFRDKAQYSQVHLFFTGHVDSVIMQDISQSKLVDRIKTFKELNCDFIAYESRVFLFGRRLTIPSLFFPETPGEIRRKEIDQTAKQIVSVCVTIKEYPYIRYTNGSKICSDLATKVEAGLNKLIAQLPEWEIGDRERGTLLIVDRSIDPVAPLMHEYTYQAMVQDLLEVKGEVVSIPKREKDSSEDKKEKDLKEDLLIGEDDNLWTEYRHQHIGEVMQAMTKKFSEFKGKNAMANISSKQDASVKDMIQAMKSMPEYKSMMRHYFKHMSIAEECMKHFDDEYLQSISELEQDMATGADENRSAVKPKDIKNKITTICQSEKISVLNKLRLLMIYIISQGGIGASRKDLWMAAGITFALEKAITNLKHLGIDIQRKPQQTSHNERYQSSDKNTRISLALMRFTPVMYDVVNSFARDTLSKDQFPYLKDPPPKADPGSRRTNDSVTSQRKRGNWRTGGADKSEKKEADKQPKTSGPRLLVYVLGGVTFSELRSIHEVARDTEANLLVGSTEPLNAKEYIRGLGQFPEDADLTKSNAASTKKAPGAGGKPKPKDDDDDGLSDDDDDAGSGHMAVRVGR